MINACGFWRATDANPDGRRHRAANIPWHIHSEVADLKTILAHLNHHFEAGPGSLNSE
jgi:hypothetical protein